MPIGTDVLLGEGVRVLHPELVNLYGCSIGDETRIGSFVEIQRNVKIGKRCKISSQQSLVVARYMSLRILMPLCAAGPV